jgi:hypothetical protein
MVKFISESITTDGRSLPKESRQTPHGFQGLIRARPNDAKEIPANVLKFGAIVAPSKNSIAKIYRKAVNRRRGLCQ